MPFFIKRFGRALLLLLFFVMMTILFYQGMNWIDQIREHGNRYQEPEHGAVSVTSDVQATGAERNGTGLFSGWQRILVFIRDGE